MVSTSTQFFDLRCSSSGTLTPNAGRITTSPDDTSWKRSTGSRESARMLDAHRLDALVDVGVMNDFAGEKHAAIGKLAARLVGVIDGAIDAVTKAELFRELEVETAGRRFVAQGFEAFDDGALIGTRQNRPDLGFQAETLLEIHFVQRNSSITFLPT